MVDSNEQRFIFGLPQPQEVIGSFTLALGGLVMDALFRVVILATGKAAMRSMINGGRILVS